MQRLKSFLKFFDIAEYTMLAFVFAFSSACYALALFYGEGETFRIFLYGHTVRVSTAVILISFVVFRVFYIMAFVRPRHLTRYLIDDFRNVVFTKERMVRAIVPFFSFVFLLGTFTSMKTLIPDFHAYEWDPFLAAFDRRLHFGIEPWRLLQPMLGYPLVTFIINVFYNIWFLVMFTVLYWQLFSLRDTHLRMQFFYTFFLSWAINGTLLAIVLSSAGPCFYEYVAGGENPFDELMAYLRGIDEALPIWAVSTQDMLWEKYQAGELAIGSGISAMPSMHVSQAFVFFLVGRRTNRAAAIVLGGFAFLIMIGSVHLGWHYAVDGYFSLVSTFLIWRFSGWLIARFEGAGKGVYEQP